MKQLWNVAELAENSYQKNMDLFLSQFVAEKVKPYGRSDFVRSLVEISQGPNLYLPGILFPDECGNDVGCRLLPKIHHHLPPTLETRSFATEDDLYIYFCDYLFQCWYVNYDWKSPFRRSWFGPHLSKVRGWLKTISVFYYCTHRISLFEQICVWTKGRG